MRVRQISESAFTVQGHGVHTAFVETVNALKNYADTSVLVNQVGRADVTHVHTVGPYALGFLLFSSGKKVVSAHIVPDSLVGSLIGTSLWLPLARLYLRWFYNRADSVIAVSDSTKRELEAVGVTKPIEVVYNMIDVAPYAASKTSKPAARKKLGIKSDDWVVMGSGQIQPRKRVDSFVNAARACPDMRFVWVGGMPFKKLAAEGGQMQEIIETAPSNVTFTGVVPLETMREYYHAADAFYLPSQQETFGLVVVEAAAAGLPIILRDIPDYAETFVGDALCVDESKVVETLHLLKNDTKAYKKAQLSAGRIASRYSAERSVKRLLEVYSS